MMCIIYVDEVVVYVRPAVQIVTITLLIHYCISSTTYAITIYNVKISNENYRILEIIGNSYKYIYIVLIIPIVFVLDMVYNSVSINFIG